MEAPMSDLSPRSPTFTLIHGNEADDLYSGFPKRTSPTPMESRRCVNLEETVPPTNDHRTLVLCFDGTGDQFDDDNSNVVNFFSLLKKDDPSKQLVYYQSGIGTYNIPQVARPWMAKLHRAVDAMLGSHLNSHVMAGYEFLMQNYEHGDKICMFGFSRGAYTARALAGMLHKIGLLPKCNHQQVPFAYNMYSRDDEEGWKQSTAFKKSFCIDVDIEFLGVWDTVSSVGFVPRRLPFTRSNTHVRYFRHAIALDEHRARFLPNFWALLDKTMGVGHGEMPKSRRQATKKPEEEEHGVAVEEEEIFDEKTAEKKTLRQLEREYSDAQHHHTHVEEVWFVGAHCDVGGGALPNGTRNYLARIPLRWMIRQCFELHTGIIFHADMLRLAGLEPRTLYPHVLPRPSPLLLNPSTSEGSATISSQKSKRSWSQRILRRRSQDDRDKPLNRTVDERTRDFISEEDEDFMDAMCDINDELKRVRAWWILELFPQQLRFQDHTRGGLWLKKLIVHRARGRHIPRQSTDGVKLHRTVKMRMDALGYEPRAKLKKETTLHWVD
ncbi:Zn(2)-C6 fungal-type domain-containing protein [Mycena indigotica]|uniref:Zn(2)-C6 fungal-type domain-containing protein n=1 Tax=Mycena indigotica TaxID=2126181 RepID=A0A8H6W7F8_9AGAR|nr:Zn(2)-C6 fungal-type domain-containing protein [Mycena indigotica]KAF7307637.1 Zn(2)-C6 fungal-type domain-containing protein [Mycena indigotica]